MSVQHYGPKMVSSDACTYGYHLVASIDLIICLSDGPRTLTSYALDATTENLRVETKKALINYRKEAYEHLVVALVHIGSYDEAKALTEEAARRFPEDENFRSLLPILRVKAQEAGALRQRVAQERTEENPTRTVLVSFVATVPYGWMTTDELKRPAGTIELAEKEFAKINIPKAQACQLRRSALDKSKPNQQHESDAIMGVFAMRDIRKDEMFLESITTIGACKNPETESCENCFEKCSFLSVGVDFCAECGEIALKSYHRLTCGKNFS